MRQDSFDNTIDGLARRIMDLPPKDRAQLLHQVATLSRQRPRSSRSKDSLLEMARRGRGLLTVREEQVLQMLVSGFANKEMATIMNLSIRTIELHRSRLMHKMLARNAADLCRIVAALELEDVDA